MRADGNHCRSSWRLGGLVAAERAALRRRWLSNAHEYGGALPILDRISQVARYGYGGQFAVAVAVAERGGDHCERDTRPSAQDRAARTDSRAGRQPPAPATDRAVAWIRLGMLVTFL